MKNLQDMISLLGEWRYNVIEDMWKREQLGASDVRRCVLTPFGAIPMITFMITHEKTLKKGDISGSIWWKTRFDISEFPWFIDYERVLVYYLPKEDATKALFLGSGEMHRYEGNTILMQYGFLDNHVPVTVQADRPAFSIVARYDLFGWDLTVDKDNLSGSATHEQFPNYELKFKWDRELGEFDFSLVREYKRLAAKPTIRSWSNKSLTASLQGVAHDIPCYLSIDDQNEV